MIHFFHRSHAKKPESRLFPDWIGNNTDGGVLAIRNSANHPYCFLSNKKKVQILAFLHVICERNVSCPPPENRLHEIKGEGMIAG